MNRTIHHHVTTHLRSYGTDASHVIAVDTECGSNQHDRPHSGNGYTCSYLMGYRTATITSHTFTIRRKLNWMTEYHRSMSDRNHEPVASMTWMCLCRPHEWTGTCFYRNRFRPTSSDFILIRIIMIVTVLIFWPISLSLGKKWFEWIK